MGVYCHPAKFNSWEGYDFQEIVVWEDPGTLDGDQVAFLQNLISHGDLILDVKYGSIPFRSKLVIFTSNIRAQDLYKGKSEEVQSGQFG